MGTWGVSKDPNRRMNIEDVTQKQIQNFANMNQGGNASSSTIIVPQNTSLHNLTNWMVIHSTVYTWANMEIQNFIQMGA